MRNLMAKLAVVVVAAAMCFGARAESEVGTDGNTYEYTVSNGEATITAVTLAVEGNVEIPSKVGADIPVVAIKNSAFQHKRFVNVKIPDSVKSIGGQAFYYCWKMESLTIGSGVESIGKNAFENCGKLATITVDAANASFASDDNVLYNKAKTKIVLVPETRTSIEIPATVTEIDRAALMQFREYTSLTVADGSAAYSAQDNFLYSKDKTVLFIAPKSLSGTFDIPATVTKIGEEAFNVCPVAAVTFPEGLLTIGNKAFESCYNLAQVDLPDGIETIGDDAFSSCDDLAYVELGGVRHIGGRAFYGCDSLTKVIIPNTTTNVGGMAFAECSSLYDVTIGSGVAKLGEGRHWEVSEWDGEDWLADVEPAFGGCSSLMDFKLAEGNATYEEIGGCIYLRATPKEAKTLVAYPAGRDDLYFSGDVNVTEIGEGACAYCYNFTEIYMPNSVREIGAQSFYCDSGNFSKLVIPDGPTNIAYQAFMMNPELMYVEIAGTVKRIGEEAFVHDYMGGDFWTTKIPGRLVLHEGIEEIADGAFDFCQFLGAVLVPDSVTTLGQNAFSQGYYCKQIIVGAGVTTISASAFLWDDECESLTIGENVKTIEECAFAGCDSLSRLVVPPSVTSIEGGAFADCDGLGAIYLPAALKPASDEDTMTFLTNVFENLNVGTLAAIVTWYADESEIGLATVTFNPNYAGGAVATRKVFPNETVGMLPASSRAGYRLVGWFAEPECVTPVAATTVVTGDVTFYAQWEVAQGPVPPQPEPEPEPEPEPQPAPAPAQQESAQQQEPAPQPMPVLWSAPVSAAGAAGQAGAVQETVPVESASVYDGFLIGGSGNVAGTVQVKVAKPKDGKAKATVTLQPATGKKTVVNGTLDVATGGVSGIDLALGADGMAGSWNGYTISGSRNLFASKDKSEQGEANAMLKSWQGAVNVAWKGARGWNGLAVTVAAKGKAKVSGTLADGTKVSANGQLIVGEEWCCVPVVATKAKLAFSLWLPMDHALAPMVDGLGAGAKVGKSGSLAAGSAFRVDAAEAAAAWAGALTDYLPDGVSVSQGGTKWTVAGGAKAGKITMNKAGEIDDSKAGANPSGLKLTNKAKSGTFSGSFKVYVKDKGKLKTTSVSVSGVMIGGKGYGTAAVKKQAGIPVTVENCETCSR